MSKKKNLLNKAMRVGVEAHAAQTRDDGSQYIAHLFNVVLKLIEHGVTENYVLAAAFLHDIIEDTYWSYSEVMSSFGGPVADIVRYCSVDTRKTKKDREKEILDECATMSREAAFVKLADMIDNLSDMESWIDTRKSKYIESKRDILAALKAGPMSRWHSLLDEAENLIDTLTRELSNNE